MIQHRFFDDYVKAWKTGKIVLNKERILLIAYLEKHIMSRDDLYFDEQKIDDYIAYTEKYFFEVAAYQKFIVPFIFLYEEDTDEPFFDEFFITIGRGGGKNGLLSTLGGFLISDLHGIKNYDISIVANSEDQARTSFDEVHNMIYDNELEDIYYNKKSIIRNFDTNSTLRYRTSNAKTKDGGREGAIFYDEIHFFENGEIVDVFSGGLGKVSGGREFKVGTNGTLREGYYDEMLNRSMAILNGEVTFERLFPFIARLDDVKEMDDPEMWPKANPMLDEDTTYARILRDKIMRDYKKLKYAPSGRLAFVSKRMNLPEVDLQKSVASVEEMKATERPIPDTTDMPGVFSLDFASVRDFAAVGALFKDNGTGEYIWKTHSFALRDYLDAADLKPPIEEWANDGLLTILQEPTINPRHVVDWFVEMREETGINIISADNYKMEFIRPLLEAEGFEVSTIRNPRAIHALLAPRVEDMFANHKIIYGDNPLMRWYTWNVYVNIKKDGNREYLKKDEHRRKTDGFMALVHALYLAAEYLDVEESEFMLDELVF
ncbi:terminase TerL endonuclease subunit [Salinicoccus roseus]|uniref:terminase TerL endonuclease subunit n=1 Tax=Salinicoccus roseus TaxID=45670 RepID=UPI002300813A|nr:terminase TerL endonuclease subunit [Salinicoccus roseus]